MRALISSALAAALIVGGSLAGPAAAAESDSELQSPRSVSDAVRAQLARVTDGLLNSSGESTVFVQVSAQSGLAAATSARRAGRTATGVRSAATRAAATAKQRTAAVIATARGVDADAAVVYEAAYSVPGVALRVDADAIAALAARSDVVSIAPVTKHLVAGTQSASPSFTAPGAATPRNANSGRITNTFGAWSAGATGVGQTIAVIDTGIDYTHATFGGPGDVTTYDAAYAARNSQDPLDPTWVDSTKILAGHDFAGELYEPSAPADDADGRVPTPTADANPIDPTAQGHGTHVSGTAAGLGVDAAGATFTGDYATLTADDASLFKVAPGMAPKAQLVPLKVFGDKGESTELVGAALDWVAEKVALTPGSIDVVNLSLGSDLSPGDDPENAKIDALTAAGVVVVAAAGNAGDLTAAGGSPGNAKSALTVAASDSGYLSFETAEVTSPAHFAGKYPGRYSYKYTGSAVTGTVARLPLSTSEDPCAPLTPIQKARVNGRIAWFDYDIPLYFAGTNCPFYENLVAAGALGVLIGAEGGWTEPVGIADVPVFSLSSSAAEALEDGIGQGIEITLDPATGYDYTEQNPQWSDQLALFSSRGEHGSYDQVVKPDVAAPGYGVISARSGSGVGATSFDGTSMATPIVAGITALVRAANPTLTAIEAKTTVINNAVHDLKVGEELVAGPLLAGTGRVDALKAVDGAVRLTSSANGSLVTASFGVVELGVGALTQTRDVTVTNTDAVDRTFDVSYLERTPQRGVEITVEPSQITVAAGGTSTVTVTLSVADPSKVEHTIDPIRNAASFWGIGNWVSSASGVLQLEDTTSEELFRLAVVASVKPTSAMSGSAPQYEPAGTTGLIPLTGRGLNLADVDDDAEYTYDSKVVPLQLGTTDPVGDSQDIGLGSVQAAASDITVVGAASDYPQVEDLKWTTLSFGVGTAANWGTLNTYTAPVLNISTDNDPEPEFKTFVMSIMLLDELYAVTIDVATEEIVDAVPVNGVEEATDTNLHDSNVVSYQVAASAVGLKNNVGTGKIRYWFSTHGDFAVGDSPEADRSTPVELDVRKPALSFYSTILPDQVENEVAGYSGTVGVERATPTTTARVLLLHLHNASGKRIEVLGHGPELTAAPVIDGVGQVGQTLTVSNGTWKNSAGATYSYQWTRDEQPIAGATKQSYRLTRADANAGVGVTVRATTAAGWAAAFADVTFVIPAEAMLDVKLAKSVVRYPNSKVNATVTLGADATSVAGTIDVQVDGDSVASRRSAAGRSSATVALPRALAVGRHVVTATFVPDEAVPDLTEGISAPRTLRVKKAKSKTTAKAARKTVKRGKSVTVRIKVTPAALANGGKIVVKRGKKVVARGTVAKGRATIKVKKLGKGKHTLRVTFQGSATAAKSKSKKITVRVR